MLRWRFLLFTLFLIFVLSFASFLSLSTFIFWFPSFLFRFRFIVAVSFCIVLLRTSIFYLCYCCFQCKFAYIIGRYRRYVVANINLSEKKNSVEKWEPSDLRFLAFYRPFLTIMKCLISQRYLSYLTGFFFFEFFISPNSTALFLASWRQLLFPI